ncbi:MAG TPA: DEAD/DEAH box helicase, partial [Candidatus Agrococcus pullicola]|nr:DEAD/DEAH box helicase [Candidatus Agrococcus pullicola]
MAEGRASSAIPIMERPLGSLLAESTVKKFKKHLSIETVGDLLWHLPRRHYRRGDLTDFSELKVDDFVTVAARIASVQTIDPRERYGPRGRKPSRTVVTISDGARTLDLVFFNMPKWQREKLRVGESGLFSGTVSSFNKKLQLAHPEWEVFDDLDASQQQSWATGLVPVYPAKKGLTSIAIRVAVGKVLEQIDVDRIPELLPDALRSEEGLLPFGRALAAYHVPTTEEEFEAATSSLKWREAMLLQTYLVTMREFNKQIASTTRPAGDLLTRFDQQLRFELTDDQRRVGESIGADLLRAHPMNRLVQGEVGSGKTVVALRAMLQVAQSGGQSVMLAPTEVLASQHFTSIVRQLGDLAQELHPVLITGQQTAGERRKAALAAASGQSRIIVGTHALFSDRTSFADLGLVVIDEQHRFGVRQREALRSKGVSPHTLLLTATPIPRTVAMTAFGDLDVSELRTMPVGRTPIATHVVPELREP